MEEDKGYNLCEYLGISDERADELDNMILNYMNMNNDMLMFIQDCQRECKNLSYEEIYFIGIMIGRRIERNERN